MIANERRLLQPTEANAVVAGAHGSIRVGTSGWVYGDWRERFYPKGLAQHRWLSYYAQHFDTVELNATTYRLPKPEQVRAWCEIVPDGFRYTVKLSRLITHRRELPPRVDEFIRNFFDRAGCFAPNKLAQILIQFPPYLTRDDLHLQRFLDKLPPEYRYVVEFRNDSWFCEEVRAILTARQIAFCIHDYPGLHVPHWVTCETLAYLRLHGATALYAGSYSRRRLLKWATILKACAARVPDVYAYFNNDVLAAAAYDAAALKRSLAGGV